MKMYYRGHSTLLACAERVRSVSNQYAETLAQRAAMTRYAPRVLRAAGFEFRQREAAEPRLSVATRTEHPCGFRWCIGRVPHQT